MRCEVTWIPVEHGGRRTPPSGTHYITVARFDEDGDSWQKVAWSVILEFEPNQGLPVHFAEARFLSPDGPVERLKSGHSFALFEGTKHVADVRLL